MDTENINSNFVLSEEERESCLERGEDLAAHFLLEYSPKFAYDARPRLLDDGTYAEISRRANNAAGDYEGYSIEFILFTPYQLIEQDEFDRTYLGRKFRLIMDLGEICIVRQQGLAEMEVNEKEMVEFTDLDIVDADDEIETVESDTAHFSMVITAADQMKLYDIRNILLTGRIKS